MRIEGIMARSAPVIVMFCRKPRKWTQMVKWNTATDTFERGQWIRGRLWTRSADVSPDGSKLIYNLTRYLPSGKEHYTVISKPPFFTAIACWSILGYGAGGGRFRTDDEVELHDPLDRLQLVNGEMPRHVQFVPAAPHSSYWALVPEQLDRNGWGIMKPAVEREYTEVRNMRRLFDWASANEKLKDLIPSFLERFPNPDSVPFAQRESLEPEIRRRSGHPYSIEVQIGWGPKSYSRSQVEGRFLILGNQRYPLEGATWADVDQAGRAVFARKGVVYTVDMGPNGSPTERPLADSSQDRFEEVIAPEWATKW